MNDKKKTKAQLLDELAGLRRQVRKQEKLRKSLKESEEKYRATVNRLEEGYYEVDLDGKYTFINPAAGKFHGRSPDELIGTSYSDYTTPETAKRIFQIFNEIFQTGHPSKIFDYQLVHKDGNFRDLEISVSLIRDAEGNPTGFRGIGWDATERKKIEEEQKRYRDFIENMDDACFELDLAGKVIFGNNVLPRILGYTPEEYWQLKPVERYTTPEDAKRVFGIYADMYRTGKRAVSFFSSQRGKDGRIVPLETSALLVRDAEGKPIGFRGIIRDVTERKKMEAEQGRYRDFIENMDDVCVETDLEGKVIFSNNVLPRITGYTPEEFDQLKREDRYATPEEARRTFQIYTDIYRQGKGGERFYANHRTKEGKIVTLELSVSLVRDAEGNPVGFRGIGRDVTERKKMEAEQERYRNFVENITDGVWENDLAGNMTFANEASCRTFGYTREELIGMNNRTYTTPKTAKRIFKMFNEIYKTGSPAEIFDYEIIRKDGEIRFLEMSASLMKDPEGNPIGFRGVSRDVTERKKMQAEQERSRDFVENISDGCWENDLAGNMTFVNEANCRIFGYTKEELMGMNNRTYTTPETAKRIFKTYNEIYRTGIPAQISDYEIIRKDGEIRQLEMSVSLIRDKAGKPTGFRGVSRDITERKKLEAEKERYREFVENITDGCWETDLAGNMTFANESAGRTMGYTREEFLSLKSRPFSTPEGRKEAVETFTKLYQTGNPITIFDHEMRRKDGEIIQLEMSVSLIRDDKGNPTGFRGVSRDITERKKMEAENERYRDFVENITDGCFEVDLTGNIIFVNQATLKRAGFTREEFKTLNIEPHTSPDTTERLTKIFTEVYRTGLPSEPFEYEISSKDGESHWIEMAISLIKDQAGKPLGFRGVSRDVTDRKKREAETIRLIEQLNEARKMEAIGTLAGGIAHDFNNLLMGIQGYTSLMLLDIDPSHSFYEKLKAIEGQVVSAADLTGQLLGYARGGRYEVKATNLNALINKTASIFGRTKKEIIIRQTLDKDLWKVEADQGQIEQVLLNLFMNAWQAMPGGGSLFLQTGNVFLDESFVKPYETKPGPFVKISVTDTGVGMDMSTKERIFEPFFTTKEMGRGAGLGLASAYGIIRGHGGMITVDSEKGYGTTFNIFLPASKKEVIPEKLSLRETSTEKNHLLG